MTEPIRFIHSNGYISYQRDGAYHREDGQTYVNAAGNRQLWYQNNKLHREDGPAIEYLDEIR